MVGANGESDTGSCEMTAWVTTVDQLMLIFRDALRVLAPHIERARIEWRDGSAYDDWDEIAQVLYEKIVVVSVKWAIPEDEREGCHFPDYNMTYESYADRTVIVVNRELSGERLVFHSFTTDKEPFDKARACRVDRVGRVLSGNFVLIGADTATYSVETPEMLLTEIAVDV